MSKEQSYRDKKITIGRKELMLSELTEMERDVYFKGHDNGSYEKGVEIFIFIGIVLFGFLIASHFQKISNKNESIPQGDMFNVGLGKVELEFYKDGKMFNKMDSLQSATIRSVDFDSLIIQESIK